MIALCLAFPPLAVGQEVPGDGELVFGVVYRQDRHEQEVRFDELRKWLGERSWEIELRYFHRKLDMERLLGDLKAGVVDVAGELPPYVYLQNAASLRPLARSLFAGRDSYRSLVVVRAKSEINSLSDLAGRTIALTTAKSTSGFIYPRSMIYEQGLNLEQLQLERGSDEPQTIYYRVYTNRTNVKHALLGDEQIAAGVLPDFELEIDVEGLPPLKESVSVLSDGRSEPIPNGVFVCRASLSPEISARLTEDLIALTNNPPEGFFDEWAPFTGWVRWKEGDYVGLQQALDTPSPAERAVWHLLVLVGLIVLGGSGLVVYDWLRKRPAEEQVHA